MGECRRCDAIAGSQQGFVAQLGNKNAPGEEIPHTGASKAKPEQS